MPCIQDRIKSFLIHMRREDIFTIIIMLLIFTLGILAYVIPPDELIINPVFKTRTELFLTITIGMFVLLEGYSTFSQLLDNRKRDIIIDLRNELENIYGPLFTVLYPYIDEEDMTGAVNTDLINSKIVNEKFSTYPYVFSDELYTYWKSNIQSVFSILYPEQRIDVSLRFAKIFCDEYNEKVNSYRKLIGKEPRKRKQNKQRKTTMAYK